MVFNVSARVHVQILTPFADEMRDIDVTERGCVIAAIVQLELVLFLPLSSYVIVAARRRQF